VSINYRGVTFSGYSKPKRTPNHKTKSHAVLVKDNGKDKLIRFGQQGVSGDKKNTQDQNLLKQGTAKT